VGGREHVLPPVVTGIPRILNGIHHTVRADDEAALDVVQPCGTGVRRADARDGSSQVNRAMRISVNCGYAQFEQRAGDMEMTMAANPTDFERMFPDWPMPRISSGGRIEVGALGGIWQVFDEHGNYLGACVPGDPEFASNTVVQRLLA
jgi:hypothetical protein